MAARKKPRTTPRRRGRSKPASAPDRSSAGPLPVSFNYRAFMLVLAAGIIVRLVVFAYMGFFNNDNHLLVIDYVARYWIPAHSDQFNQAYHPPLYYFLAAPLLRLGGVTAVHGLSLIFSIATFLLIAHLLRQLPWIDEEIRPWCLALAAFQPQFVLFSLFISNDTLAILLSILIFHQSWRVQLSPSLANCFSLGICLGLGLLTKAVFMVFVIPLILFIWLIGHRRTLPSSQLLSRLASFLLTAGLLGCYKYVENFILFGNPTVSNLDFWNWTSEQQPTWLGISSLLDFNLLKLVRDPVISASTVHSYPLMLYGSFWYALIPESTFRSNLVSPFNHLGSMIYLAALCPTLLMLIGANRIAMAALGIRAWAETAQSTHARNRLDYEGVLLLTFLLNFLLIVTVGWSSDVWSVFQGRLLFPSFFPLLLAFNAGMEGADHSRLLANLIRCLMAALIALFLVYIIVEVWLAIYDPVNPFRMDHVPFKVDMHAR
jgi:4-amino-4-deoxy-L-arabinose transferase-like glycosyltransferase